jgi:O-antigen ligase
MTIGYAENGFLEIWLQLGTIGLSLTLMLFGRAIWQSVRLLRSRCYTPPVAWFSAIIFLELVTNIEAGIVMDAFSINWTLTLIALVGLANEARTMADSEPTFLSAVRWPEKR